MKWSPKIFSYIIGLILIGLSFYFFGTIWLYIILASVISLIVQPLTKLISRIEIKNYHLPNGIIAAFSLFAFWTVFLIFVKTFVPLIINEANELSKIDTQAIESYFHEDIEKTQILIKQFVIQDEDFNFRSYLQEKAKVILNLEHIKQIFTNTIGTIGDILIAFFAISFIAFFFIKDNKLLMRAIISLAPTSKEQTVKLVLTKVIRLLSRYFIGLIIEVSAIIIIVSMGLWAVGIGFSHAIVIGLIAGLLNVIPYIGPLIGMTFGSVIALATELTNGIPSNFSILFIGIIAVFLLAQIIDNFLLQPIIYSNSVNATALEIFLVILMAGTLGGITGMILGIPVYTIIRVIAKEILGENRIVKKLTKNI